MLTREHPYAVKSGTATIMGLWQQINNNKFRAEDYELKVGEECKDLLNRLLEMDPRKRPWDILENSQWLNE